MDIKFAFNSFEHLVTMEGHGPYVWASYAITFTVLAFLSLAPVLKRKAFLSAQKRVLLREESA